MKPGNLQCKVPNPAATRDEDSILRTSNARCAVFLFWQTLDEQYQRSADLFPSCRMDKSLKYTKYSCAFAACPKEKSLDDRLIFFSFGLAWQPQKK